MNAIVQLPTAPFGMAHLVPPPRPPIEAILAASGPAFMGVFAPDADRPELSTLRAGIARAEAFLKACAAHTATLREAAEPLSVDEIGRQVGAFVTAWPNASSADLAGYGAQLAEDIIERRPCRHALRSALRQLRHTSRFLPAIVEVLGALDAAQSRVRNTAWHVAQIPAELARARAGLAAAEARAATPRQPRPDQEHQQP